MPRVPGLVGHPGVLDDCFEVPYAHPGEVGILDPGRRAAHRGLSHADLALLPFVAAGLDVPLDVREEGRWGHRRG